MKSWEIIGWAKDGAPFCLEHAPEGSTPVFASDEYPFDYCDTCLSNSTQEKGK
jgi:hypothetical protein